MVPQPRAVVSSATVIIHELIRNSKQDKCAGETNDLLDEGCMAHRKRYFRNDHALEIPHGHGRRGGAKARDEAY